MGVIYPRPLYCYQPLGRVVRQLSVPIGRSPAKAGCQRITVWVLSRKPVNCAESRLTALSLTPSRTEARDILTPMNYRRDFQHIYAALTVAWIVIVLTNEVRYRPHHVDLDAVAQDIRAATVRDRSGPFIRQAIEKHTGPPTPAQRIRYWGIGSAVTLLLPVVGYTLLFMVVPWAYRGLSSGTDN